MLLRLAPLAFLVASVLAAPASLRADEDGGVPFDGGPLDAPVITATEDAGFKTDASPTTADASPTGPDADPDAPRVDGGGDAAAKLLPDGGARGLVADSTGCGVGHGPGSPASAAMALGIGLALIIARRRGRS